MTQRNDQIVSTIATAVIAAASTCLVSCGSPPPEPSIPATPSLAASPITAQIPAEQAPAEAAEPEPTPGFVQPAVEPGENGWEVYTSVVEVTPASAARMQPGTVSPEAAVIHFYAGLMLGDGSHEAVLVPERSERMQKKLDEVLTWTYSVVRLERRKPSGDGPLWIKIYYEVEAPIPSSGRVDHEQGTDDAEVTEIDGEWYVSGVPS